MTDNADSEARTTSSTDDENAVDLETMLHSLVNESVRSRLRHRALLSVLEKSGNFAMADYIEAYKAEEEHNFEPLLDLLLMRSDRFRERHAAWLESERKRFGFTPAVVQGVILTERPSGTPAIASDEGKTKKPRAKGKRVT